MTLISIRKGKYSSLKASDKPAIREKCYEDIIFQSLTTMFDYAVRDIELQRSINLRLEEMLRVFGKVAWFKDGDVVKFGECHYIDNVGAMGVKWDGTSQSVVITTLDGKQYYRTVGVDCVVMGNNNLQMSELNIYRFVEQLSEVDLSQVDLLINARNHPVIIAKTEADAEIIRKAIKDNKDGLPLTVACTGSIVRREQGSDDGIEVLTVTDPQTATLFQYYSHYHLDLTGRIYGMYGLSTFNTGKMAQTNNLEVSGTLASSMVIPMNNYHARLTACEEIESVLGVHIDIEFGECWKNQLAMLRGIDKKEFNVVEELDEANVDELAEPNEDEPKEDKEDVKDVNEDGEEMED